MKNSSYNKSNRKSKLAELKIVSPSYLRFDIGDRVAHQYFSTDETPSYAANYGTVFGYMYVSPKVLDANDEYRQLGWHYWVLFDQNIGETPGMSYFDHIHEGDLFAVDEMPRWDDLLFLIRFLTQSIIRKFFHR